MKKGRADFLLFLVSSGAAKGFASASTSEIAQGFGVSQQSASRWLSSLEKEGLIERKRAGVKLSEKGLAELKKTFLVLQASFSQQPLELKGTVFTGLNDGKYYLSLEGYRRQFEQKLGFIPFPGTLNLRVSDASKKAFLSEARGVVLKGFSFENRVFGALKVFPAEVNGVAAAVVIPERSHYGNDVIELASRFFLREKLGLKDGSHASVTIRLDDSLV